jgi:hypothetical protein
MMKNSATEAYTSPVCQKYIHDDELDTAEVFIYWNISKMYKKMAKNNEKYFGMLLHFNNK